MARFSKIGWTKHTFNPWWGCNKVSPECQYCYIGNIMKRGGREPFHGPMRTRDWTQPRRWNRLAEKQGKRDRVFTCSMSDFFHEGADAWRTEAWELIKECPNLDWLILTKRADRIADQLPSDWGAGYPNVWLGVTAGCRSSFWRINELIQNPAVVRFVSAEPLLEAIDLTPYLPSRPRVACMAGKSGKPELQDLAGRVRTHPSRHSRLPGFEWRWLCRSRRRPPQPDGSVYNRPAGYDLALNFEGRSMTRRTLGLLLAVEIFAAAVLIGWRTTRPSAPRLNLSRMPPQTAEDLEVLRNAADRGGVQAWVEYGQACLANGFSLESQAVLLHAARLDPSNSDAQWFLARAHEKLGDCDHAILAYQELLTAPASGRQSTCWYRIGRNHLRGERLAEAKIAFERAGTLPAALLERARLALKVGKLEEADHLIQDLQKRPVPDIYVEMLAVELARQRERPAELARALERLERSQGVLQSQLEWQDVEAVRSSLGLEGRLVGIQRQSTQHSRGALAEFKAILATVPPEYLDPFASVALQLPLQAHDITSLDSMKAHFERRLALPPMAQHYIAQAYWEAKDERRIEAASRSANALLPMTETSDHLATIAASQGDYPGERKMASLALSIEGTTQYRLSQFDRASQMLEQAVALNPDDSNAWFYLGELSFAGGDFEQARKRYQRCLVVNPRHGRAAERLTVVR